MVKEHILLLLKQRLISRRRFEKKTGVNIEESFSNDHLNYDETKIKIVSNYFNVSKSYFEKGFRYNLFLKYGNIFILLFFFMFLIPLIFLYSNKNIELIYLLIMPVISVSILIPIMICYRKFSLSILLLIPLLFSFYLLGLYTMYVGVLRYDARIIQIIFG